MSVNLAAVLTGPKTVEIEERADPQPRAHEVVVQVSSVGICGSDVHYYLDGRIADFVVTAPLILGHEASGVVAARGANAGKYEVGQRVAIEPGVPDGVCDQCLAGRYNLCADVQFFATPPVDGAFVRRLAIAEAFVHAVPDNLSDDAAALIEPLSVAVAACRRAGVTVGSRVLVTGAGPIGVLMAQVALRAGATTVLLTDVQDARRDRAAALTDAAVLHPSEVPTSFVADVFLECSGAPSAAIAGISALRPAGIAILVGMGADELTLPIGQIQAKELWITGAFRYANTYPAAIALAASGAVDLDALVDRHFPLSEAESALNAAHSDPSIMKAVVRVQD